MTSVFFTFEHIRNLRQGYEERIGKPNACASALGHLIVGFSWLEKSLTKHIVDLAKLTPHIAPALTAEMSFKNKVSAISSLVCLRPPLRQFNCGTEDTDAMWKDIVSMLFKAEEMRNTMLHSEWSLPHGSFMRRTKTTAKAAKGIRIIFEEHDSAYILDVYDYILNVMVALDDFFL